MDDYNQIYRTLQQDGMGKGGEGSKMEDIFKRKTKDTAKGKGTVEQKSKMLEQDIERQNIFWEERQKIK